MPTIQQHGISISDAQLSSLKFEGINIARDLWKLALVLAFFKEDGVILTKELLNEVPKLIDFDEKYQKILPSNKQSSYIQIIKNLKSNKNNSTNWIKLGYVEDLPRKGFKITQKGIELVKNELLKTFSNR